jgi:hypothetical protein
MVPCLTAEVQHHTKLSDLRGDFALRGKPGAGERHLLTIRLTPLSSRF